MHRSTSSRTTFHMQQNEEVIDLSGVVPAIAPPVAVSEALGQEQHGGEDLYETLLRHRLATEYRLSERNLVLLRDLDAVVAEIVAQLAGPLVLFPPTGMNRPLTAALEKRQVVEIARGFSRDGAITLETACDLPHDGIAVVASPGDPLANLLSANDAVRLARSCKWLVVDERYAEYAGQSLLSVASEFSNVIVLRSFQARLGATDANAGWAIGSPRARDVLANVSSALPPGIAQAVLAAGCDKPASRMVLSLVREERSRLYRALRKLSYMQPLPSWGPFVAARVDVGSRDALLALLYAKGIRIHAPQDPGLERYVRIGIGTRSAMEYLRRTLLEIAPEILGAQLASSGCDSDCLTLGGEEFGQSKFRQVKQRRQRSA